MVSRSSSVLYADPITDLMTGYVDHYISGASAFQSNYQVLIRVYRGYGTNTGNVVYIPASELRSDYSDIRFVDGCGCLLPYWIESSSSTYADIWVLIYQIPTTGAMIRILYGGGAVVAASNGATTFPLCFDHFDGSAIDETIWTKTNTINLANSIATFTYTPGASQILSKVNLPTTVAIRSRAKWIIDTTYEAQFGIYDNTKMSNFMSGYVGASFYAYEQNSTYTSSNLGSSYTSDYHLYDILHLTTSDVFVIDGSTVATLTSKAFSTTTGVVQVYSATSQSMDWILARNYTSPEPSPGWWGSLEDL